MAPRSLYILCGNAAYNRGDRGNLMSQIDLLRARFPEAEIVIDSYRPETDSAWFGVKALKRSFFLTFAQIRAIRRADAVVWGGGALLADNSCRLLIPQWLAVVAFIRLVLRRPIMVWAQGLVIETKAGAMLARLALMCAATATVRDRNSYETFQRLRPGIPCRQTADPAVLLAPGARGEGEALLAAAGVPMDRPLVCLSPTFWHFYHEARSWLPYPMGKRFSLTVRRNEQRIAAYCDGLAKLAAELVERFDANVLIVPRYASPLWEDMRYCRAIREASGYSERVFVLEGDDFPPRQFFALWRCFDMVVSSAMHDAIFAAALDRPSLHLYYEPKGKDFFEGIDAPAQIMPWETLLEEGGPQKIAEHAQQVHATWESERARRQKALAAVQAKARQNADVLDAMLKGEVNDA